jgi:hypothetical protein
MSSCAYGKARSFLFYLEVFFGAQIKLIDK